MAAVYIDGNMLKKMIKRAATVLNENKAKVDSLNVFPVPDGDTGTNMSLTIESAAQEIEKAKKNSVSEVAEKAARGSLMGARGNSGVILSQILRGFAKAVEKKEKLGPKDLAYALQKGSETAYKAVMKPVEGTILTIARECGKNAVNLAYKGLNSEEILEKTILHCEEVLEKTPEMLPILKEAGVVDAGGKGFIYILKGALEALKGFEDEPSGKIAAYKDDKSVKKFTEEDFKLQLQYCTEIVLSGNNIDTGIIKKDFSKLGDSLLVVGDKELVKIHIHTNHPGEALEYCLKLGELKKIKIDNMKEQHKEFIRHNNVREKDISKPKHNKKIGIISVVSGKGFEEIFTGLGTDKIIQGGQTMNPSTQDILSAIEELDLSEVIILPNNSNIILAAQQAKRMSNKNVYVVPSKSIPQGISALLALNPNESIEKNAEKMEKAVNNIKTIEITYAVRDSVFNGFQIKSGDILGIIEGEIKEFGENINEVLFKILNNLYEGDYELLTIFYGKDIEQKEAEMLSKEINSKYRKWDVELHYGGQPLYFYIISLE
ncbi:MAG: fatty acid kinase [Thermosediminibacterales bacterium]|nr:fatty acid kinase [Thermosediminibacterales bacterium]